MTAAPFSIHEPLLAWYAENRRSPPWRAAPGVDPDPYHVFLSEIMLQQTGVATATPYFERFRARWPTIEALADASLDDVLAAWAGLGYYSRARNLHACARLVVERHGGRFPRETKELLSLPGIGLYTAGAIQAIAFGLPALAQDGNVERVVSRLFAIDAPPPALKARIREAAQPLVPQQAAGDFAQALMDLGALVCRPRTPACGLCPLSTLCRACAAGAQHIFPPRPRAAPKPERKGAAFVLLHEGRVLLERRPARGLLGGMSAFPSTPLTQTLDESDWLLHEPAATQWRRMGEVRHIFTHFSLLLAVHVGQAEDGRAARANSRWARTQELAKEGLPTLMRKVAARAGLV